MLALSLAAFAVVCAVGGLPMADVHVYRAEGEAVSRGTDLYGFAVTDWKLPATYPPFAALLFVPVGWLSLTAAKAAFLVGNVVLLVLLVHLSLRFTDLPRRRELRLPLLLSATAVGLWLEPVFQTTVFGQINLVLACLVLWDLGRPDGARGKGLAVGVAAGIKLTPAVFAVYLLLTGRVRAGLAALAGFAGTVALGALVLPGASWEFWTRRIFETTRVGKAWIVDNQSLQGLAARVAHTAEPGMLWLVPAAVLAVAGLALACRLRGRHGLEGWGVLVTALTALLVSPISWSHHWVWCVPLLVLMAAEPAGRGAAVAVYAVFTARTLWLVPKHGTLDLRLPWWAQPLASPYPLLTVVLLAGVAARCYSASGAAPPPEVSGAPGASGSAAGSGAPASTSWESTMR
ncbi:glycosyltransferase 87 family protein [Streptomyces ovatisporus]|uniref:Glycosyltransferase 87 family protein n=1 Tax=Streptomyces ovatisporus TaxID=1128682 RepID=A0ABV9A7I8_9ACTN